ncbi:MAG: hypothetical protein CMJ86_07165, partial [Planctomycetes bacterium]|nr:hypothetical protein [Planctomycetota bacterium]
MEVEVETGTGGSQDPLGSALHAEAADLRHRIVQLRKPGNALWERRSVDNALARQLEMMFLGLYVYKAGTGPNRAFEATFGEPLTLSVDAAAAFAAGDI